MVLKKSTYYLIIILVFRINCFAQIIEIQSSVNNNQWSKTNLIYPLKGDVVKLKVDKIEGATIRWYQIIPDIWNIYKNANRPSEKDAYKWIGLAKIEYQKKELKQFLNEWEIMPFNKNIAVDKEFLANLIFYNNDVGSFWFQAIVEKNGKIFKSYGIESSDEK